MPKSAVTHGGKRKKAGRKPVDDPKQQLSIYVRKSQIDAIGGDEPTKEVAYKAIEKAAKK